MDKMTSTGEVKMKKHLCKLTAHALAFISTVALFTCLSVAHEQTDQYQRFIQLGSESNIPSGWAQFCNTYSSECITKPAEPRDIVLDEKAWKSLVSINKQVNETIKPVPDMEHYGMVQWWRYPDDGAGACHSYALLKRRMLMQAGWPRAALLMTIVHETNGEGHAVLTVKTDKGEFILDNLNKNIVLWSETPYHYYKRQSQADPNAWVLLNDNREFKTANLTR
jgi:predicted transglutaminase-like cysteine proteinase